MKSSKKNNLYRLWYPILALMLCVGCNRVPNAVEEYEYTYASAYADIIQRSNPYVIKPRRNDTLQFKGTRSCTLFVDKNVDSVYADSLTVTSITMDDTVIEIDGRRYGEAKFYPIDLEGNWSVGGGWYRIYKILTTDSGYKNELLRSYCDENLITQIEQCASDSEFTSDIKDRLVTSFNRMVNELHLLSTHESDFKSLIGREENDPAPLLDILEEFFFAQEILASYNKLLNQGIFIDRNGSLKTESLSAFEQQQVKWFNIDLLVDFVFSSVFSNKEKLWHRIIPQRIIYGKGKDDWIVHYFERRDSAIYQRAFLNADGFSPVAESLAVPLHAGNYFEWNVTPLIWTSLPPVPSTDKTQFSYDGHGVFRNNAIHTLNNEFQMNLYYTMHGTSIIDNSPVRFWHTVTALQDVEGIVSGLGRGVKALQVTTITQLSYDDNKETVSQEHVRLELEE